MAAASCPSRPMSKPADGFSFGTSPKTPNQFLGRPGCKNLSFASNYAGKVKVCTSRKLTVQARYDYDFWLPAISCSPISVSLLWSMIACWSPTMLHSHLISPDDY